jgi:chemotaxis protein methyltransferase CheR
MESENDILDIEIELLIQAIYARFQYDFRQYSRASFRRRLQQAMSKFQCKTVTEIQKKLFHEPDFFALLLTYLTVNTTEMFRDPSYFNSLKVNVIPYLKTFPSIKVWVAGCSTGEEFFSLAILFKEANLKRYIIYATDINPMNLEKARKGIYDPETIQKASRNYQLSGGVSSFSDYYEAAYDSVQMEPSLLNNVVFSDHSLATDNVFSEMHFISCRNVLIYFEKVLQDRVFGLFTDSLIRDGYLGLGSKETLQFSESYQHFLTVDSHNRIYQKKGGA